MISDSKRSPIEYRTYYSRPMILRKAQLCPRVRSKIQFWNEGSAFWLLSSDDVTAIAALCTVRPSLFYILDIQPFCASFDGMKKQYRRALFTFFS
jgi:hypothetical protein